MILAPRSWPATASDGPFPRAVKRRDGTIEYRAALCAVCSDTGTRGETRCTYCHTGRTTVMHAPTMTRETSDGEVRS